MKLIVIISLVIGLTAAVVVPSVAGGHVYKVKSGYSGKAFWIVYSHQPSEEDLLDSVIYREPLIQNSYETTKAWRKAQAEHTRLFIKTDANISIVVMPYDALRDPDTVLADGTRVKGVWLTEPSTRTKIPVALVAAGYVFGSFLAFGVGSFCTLALTRWIWYFLLRRINELSSAVRGK